MIKEFQKLTNDTPNIYPLIEVGARFRFNYGKRHRANRTIEVRCIVDGGIVVYRHWHKRMKTWQYEAAPMALFQESFESGTLTLAAKSNSP